MRNKSLTVTGRPFSVTAATRLPIPTYQAAQDRAEKEGVSLCALLGRWITEKLQEQEPPSGAAPAGGGAKC